MQSLGPATRSGPKFRTGWAIWGARTKDAGLITDSEEATTMYNALAAGLSAVLERCDRALCWAQQILCGAGLGPGLAFAEILRLCPQHYYMSLFSVPLQSLQSLSTAV